LVDDGLDLLIAGNAHLLGTLSTVGEGTREGGFALGVVQIEPERGSDQLRNALVLLLGELLDCRL
jgi:hypothetical protein